MESTSFCYYSPIHFWHRSRIRFLAPKSKKSEGRQELHSNLMFLMDSIGDLAPGAPLPIWSSHSALSWTSRSKAARNLQNCAPPCSGNSTNVTNYLASTYHLMCVVHTIKCNRVVYSHHPRNLTQKCDQLRSLCLSLCLLSVSLSVSLHHVLYVTIAPCWAHARPE